MTSSVTNGNASKEVLFDSGGEESGPWSAPRFIHFWYDNLAPADALIADRIIGETLSVNK